jgi:hypothetical protein
MTQMMMSVVQHGSGYTARVPGFELDLGSRAGLPAAIGHGSYDPVISVEFSREARGLLEQAGLEVPPDGDERHVPRARFHAALAAEFGPAELVTPIYVRPPDAERAAA